MTAADLRALADLMERLAAAGFDVGLELGGEITIKARPAPVPSLQGEPFADGTRFADGTGWVEGPEDARL
jgi:hypothetical protein